MDRALEGFVDSGLTSRGAFAAHAAHPTMSLDRSARHITPRIALVAALLSTVVACKVAPSTEVERDAAIVVDAGLSVVDASPRCDESPYGCLPLPYSLVTVGGETLWVGLDDGEPAPSPPASPNPIVLARDQELRPLDLEDARNLRLPSHDDRLDRVYMAINQRSWGLQPVIFSVLEEICRLNEARPQGEEILLVLTVDDGLRSSSFPAELARRGCGFAADGTPRWVSLRQAPREPWVQDAVEFVEVELSGPNDTTATTTAVWDTPQIRSIDVGPLAVDERYPFLGALMPAGLPGDRSADRGGAGGNIESLPDGRWLVGDSAPQSLQRWTEERGGIVLPSDFLTVGHLDEWTTVRPDGVVLYSHPLMALEAIETASDADWADMQRSLLSMAQESNSLRASPGFARYALFYLRRSDIVQSVRRFLRDPSQDRPYRFDDFDTTREVSFDGDSRFRQIGSKRGISIAQIRDEDLEDFRAFYSDFIVLSNLRAFDEILDGLVTLTNATVRTEPVPELFFGGGSALPSALNAVWLDDVIVTADPGFAPFRQQFEAAAGRRVVWTNATLAWLLDGGVHCLTQVSRRPPCDPVARRNEVIFDHERVRCVCVGNAESRSACEGQISESDCSCVPSECTNSVRYRGGDGPPPTPDAVPENATGTLIEVRMNARTILDGSCGLSSFPVTYSPTRDGYWEGPLMGELFDETMECGFTTFMQARIVDANGRSFTLGSASEIRRNTFTTGVNAFVRGYLYDFPPPQDDASWLAAQEWSSIDFSENVDVEYSEGVLTIVSTETGTELVEIPLRVGEYRVGCR